MATSWWSTTNPSSSRRVALAVMRAVHPGRLAPGRSAPAPCSVAIAPLGDIEVVAPWDGSVGDIEPDGEVCEGALGDIEPVVAPGAPMAPPIPHNGPWRPPGARAGRAARRCALGEGGRSQRDRGISAAAKVQMRAVHYASCRRTRPLGDRCTPRGALRNEPTASYGIVALCPIARGVETTPRGPTICFNGGTRERRSPRG